MENRGIGRRLLVLVAALFTAAGGCGGGGKKDVEEAGGGGGGTMGATGGEELRVPRVNPELCDTKGKKVQTFDLNRDNQPDVWKLYATVDEGGTTVEVLTCKQVDYDHDGKKDYVATFKRTGEIIAEEFDFTFDGNFDAREHYDPETGEVYLVERDSDHDKQPDIWEKKNEDGQLESVRRDRNGDGKPDVWEQYVDGELTAILYDDDFDNRVDRKESRRQKTKAPSDAPPAAEEGEDPETVEGAVESETEGETEGEGSETDAPAEEPPEEEETGAEDASN